MRGRQIGPFETEQQARETPAVRAAWAAYDADPGAGKMHPHNLTILTDALSAAEVTLGEFDRRIVRWLAGWETTTVAVLAGIIRRAADGPTEMPEDDEDQDRATVLAALADAAALLDFRAAQLCGDCTSSPAELCAEHAADLDAASSYRALAAKFGGTR